MEEYEDEMNGKWNRVSKLKSIGQLVRSFLIEEFSPFYFISIMGMGISLNLLYSFDHNWLQYCSFIMFAFTCIGFIVILSSFLISIYVNPTNLKQYHTNPKIAPFMGCLPMAYMTLVNFIWFLTEPTSVKIIFALWIVAVVLSLYSSCIIFYFTFMVKLKYNKLQFKQLNLTLMFPAVAIVVCASQGNYLVEDLPANFQLFTFFTSFSLLSIGLCMAFTLIIINFARIFIYKLPETKLIFTSFLPVGFLGQAGCCTMLIGKNMKYLLKHHNFTNLVHKEILGEVILMIMGGGCLFLISFGYFMTFMAVASVLSKCKPFNVKHHHPELTKNGYLTWFRGFWALTFPLGTMSLAQYELSNSFNLSFFKIMSTVYATACITCTLACMFGVLYRSLTLIYNAN